MILAKSQIVSTIAEQNGFSCNKSTETVETIIEIIKSTFESGDDFLISGFGKFCVKEKQERIGRNPVTGDEMVLEARRVVTFKHSMRSRDVINA